MQSITTMVWLMVAALAGGALLIVGGLFLYRLWLSRGQEKGYSLAPFLLLAFAAFASEFSRVRAQTGLQVINDTLTDVQGDVSTLRTAVLAILSLLIVIGIAFLVVRRLK
jgi:hypothetical protein